MIRIADIKAAVAAEFKLSVEKIDSPGRCYELSHPRQLAMAMSVALTHHSQARVATFFRRDPTTVIYARRAVNARLRRDAELRLRTRNVLRRLRRGE